MCTHLEIKDRGGGGGGGGGGGLCLQKVEPCLLGILIACCPDDMVLISGTSNVTHILELIILQLI